MGLILSEFSPTVQSTGSLAGSPAVVLTLTGCNMWSGVESERDSGVSECAQWCDWKFAEGQRTCIYQLTYRS